MRKFFDVSTVVLCLPGLLALPVTLLAPLNVLDSHFLASFVKFVEYFVPMIRKITPFLDTWQVAKLFYSVAWVCIPFCILFWMHRLFRNEQRNSTFTNISKAKKAGALLIVWIIVLYIWYLGFSDHESGRETFIIYSRVGMATLGSLLMGTEALLAAGALVGILKFRKFIFGDSHV